VPTTMPWALVSKPLGMSGLGVLNIVGSFFQP
jgi:hypothetical protein